MVTLAPPEPDGAAGRTAIVTGAAGGIGRAVAIGFARAGASVIGVDRDPSRTATLVADGVTPLLGDVTEVDVVERAVALAIDRTGRIDVLVNNAGVHLRRRVEELAVGDFEAVHAVHVLASVYAIRAVIPPMRRQQHGRIINIISRAAELCQPATAAYAAAKAGLWALSRTVAAEVVDDGILVNSLIPGMTNTGIWERDRPELQAPEAVVPTALALATLPPGGPSGRVFWDLDEHRMYERTIGLGVEQPRSAT